MHINFTYSSFRIAKTIFNKMEIKMFFIFMSYQFKAVVRLRIVMTLT